MGYIIVMTPLNIGFGYEVEIGSATFWFDLFLDFSFFLDVVFNFRTTYINQKDSTVRPCLSISKHFTLYVSCSWQAHHFSLLDLKRFVIF